MLEFIKRQWFRFQIAIGWRKPLPPPVTASLITPQVIADQMLQYLDSELTDEVRARLKLGSAPLRE